MRHGSLTRGSSDLGNASLTGYLNSTTGAGGASNNAASTTPSAAALFLNSTGQQGNNNNTAQPTFSVKIARAMLYSRFPNTLRRQVAYKHFYTDELDGKSGILSLKFFSIFISYFCAVCRLEARRKQYLANAKETAGAEFAAAHRMARAWFQRLNSTYAEILLIYNTNHTLEFPRKITARERTLMMKGNAHTIGAKPLGPPMHRVKAFSYVEDEMRFFEEFFTFTVEIMRLAFTDESLQHPITEEVQKLFRSNSFNFSHARRLHEVENETSEREALATGLLHNTEQLAETLVAPAPKILMKYALKQRSPFIAAQFPGSMSSLHYQRIHSQTEHLLGKGGLRAAVDARRQRARAGLDVIEGNEDELPVMTAEDAQVRPFTGTKTEREFTTETHHPMFSAKHRAMSRAVSDALNRAKYMKQVKEKISRGGSMSPRYSPRRGMNDSLSSPRGTTPKPRDDFKAPPTAAGLADRRQQHTFLPNLRDYDLALERDASEEPSASPFRASRNPAASLSLKLDDDGGDEPASPLVSLFHGSPRAGGTPGSASPEDRAADRWKNASQSVRKIVRITSKLLTGPRKPASVLKRQSYADACSPLALRQLASIEARDANGEEDWTRYDPSLEIDSVYRSLANGVVLTSFGIPLDIMVDYDDAGIMMLARY